MKCFAATKAGHRVLSRFIGNGKTVQEADKLLINLILDQDLIEIPMKLDELEFMLKKSEYESKGYKIMWMAEDEKEAKAMQEAVVQRGFKLQTIKGEI
jgi:hypothetical protein